MALSVSISANDTRAPPALSACTMARDPAVGNSQSLVNETTQNRVARVREASEHAIVVGGEIEIVHRARQVEIAVGVEALDEGRTLMAQIALDLEVGVERKGRHVAVLHPAAEFRCSAASDR